MQGLWDTTAERVCFEPLKGSVETDVLVVGGGMAGILCAYMLKQAGVDCVVAEATRIGGGVTRHTTAKLTLQHGLMYDALIKRYGMEAARAYCRAQQAALEAYARLCPTLDCDYEIQDAYVYSLRDRECLIREADALCRLGVRAAFCETTPLPLKVAGTVCVKEQAQFHPLKFLYAIAKGLRIYENTKVLERMPHKAITERGVIRYRTMIAATHFPIWNTHGAYALKMYQHRSYVLALDGAPPVNGMYVDEDPKGLSFRGYGDRVLLGGGAHRTGKRGGGWRELRAFAGEQYPSARIVAEWATQDCMTLDGVPYIGRYSRRTPDLYVATGFNKWGMTSAMVSAMLLTRQIQGKASEADAVFDPSRSIWHPQLAANAWETAVGLLTPTVPRCPHLGCALKYNAAEHSWDCACHGSRFTESGKLINNPATDDKRM